MTQTPDIHDEMPKAYEPGSVEQKWYDFWMEKGYFTPVIDHNKKPFTIIMPPPNLTGELHMGHALTATLEDIMTRWHRMMGEPTLWLPGVDHAAIAAQVVVEKLIAKEGLDRHQLGREKFLERMWEWVNQIRNRITEQHKKLGVSCDWSREKFTLEEGPSLAVRTAFKRLFEKGLIYKGERIINWCPRCSTALSDLEVDHKDVVGNLWYVRYPIVGEDGYITVATTRPETILGDTAVAVNPNDERYRHLIGKKVLLPAVNREIEIIGDEAVDLEFGTGAVKITPAHDPVDFEIAQRNNLDFINILNNDVTMNENAGPYKGMDRFECRDAIVADLEKSGQMEKIEPYSHAIGHCQRCATIIEPIVSLQWFVDIKPLAEPAMKAVTDGKIVMHPARITRNYLNWMENIKDWCISRQLWWGHRIPVWYCNDCNEMMACVDEPESCKHCGSSDIYQDPDVLDTWFSSGLWPHSTLGWPEDTEDLRYFYPTSVMETAYDILPFWVSRMIMMGIEDTGEIPFRDVYFHGLIRDEKGAKMSKTIGNVLDPMDFMEQYGTDALRFGILTGTSAGNDSKLSPVKFESGRNFANKLWNATRYVIRSIEGSSPDLAIRRESLPVEDRWILSRLNRTITGVIKLMEDFQFAEAQKQIYEFLWNEYCDWYIELAKIRLNAKDNDTVSPVPVLVHVLESSLRLLHPCMPFVTEELWQNLRKRLPENWQEKESIMVSAYPEADDSLLDDEAERIIDSVVEIVRSIRNARSQYNVDNSKWIEAQVYGGELFTEIQRYAPAIENLGRARPVTIIDDKEQMQSGDKVLAMVLKETEVVIPMESMVDIEAEKQRLQKELDRDQAELDRLEVRLNDKNFLEKAPAAVVEKERTKKETIADKIERLKQQLLNY
ncbi:MAG: valine--tRNA ligase [Dehalococcoidales bacterium]|nr:valine--tRNA ligase [Dehalococcoidales bacterium]